MVFRVSPLLRPSTKTPEACLLRKAVHRAYQAKIAEPGTELLQKPSAKGAPSLEFGVTSVLFIRRTESGGYSIYQSMIICGKAEAF